MLKDSKRRRLATPSFCYHTMTDSLYVTPHNKPMVQLGKVYWTRTKQYAAFRRTECIFPGLNGHL